MADAPPRFGEESVIVTDPSGLLIELVATAGDRRTPWLARDIDAAHAVRGIHSVTISTNDPGPTLAFMREWFGAAVSNEMDGRQRLSLNGVGPGKTVDILAVPRGARAKNGVGTVHHVAFAIAEASEQLEMREALVRRGIHVTPVIDRSSLSSIYFFANLAVCCSKLRR